jgi:hypothetical protein
LQFELQTLQTPDKRVRPDLHESQTLKEDEQVSQFELQDPQTESIKVFPELQLRQVEADPEHVLHEDEH